MHLRHALAPLRFVFPAQDRATRFPPHIKNAHVMPHICSAAHVAASHPRFAVFSTGPRIAGFSMPVAACSSWYASAGHSRAADEVCQFNLAFTP